VAGDSDNSKVRIIHSFAREGMFKPKMVMELKFVRYLLVAAAVCVGTSFRCKALQRSKSGAWGQRVGPGWHAPCGRAERH